jgi:hypothetical protein
MKYNHIEYMENVAATLKELQHTDAEKHFTRATELISMEEFMANASELTGLQLIAIDEVMAALLDGGSDNILDRRTYTLFVLKNAANGDIEAQQAAREDCEAVIKKILSKLFYDYRQAQRNGNTNGLRGLEINRITIQNVGPVGDYYYGFMVMFTVLDAPGIVYNENDWVIPGS